MRIDGNIDSAVLLSENASNSRAHKASEDSLDYAKSTSIDGRKQHKRKEIKGEFSDTDKELALGSNEVIAKKVCEEDKKPPKQHAANVISPSKTEDKKSSVPISDPYNGNTITRKNVKQEESKQTSRKPCVLCKKGAVQGLVLRSLNDKYLTKMDSYNAKVINDIIYNESTNVVSVFKDYLIYDDVSEFLKRVYAGHESSQRLPKIYDFYDKYSKVFPNYVVLPENKFMFKNIERKQRLIDDQQKLATEAGKKAENKKLGEVSTTSNRIMTSNFLSELNMRDPTESRRKFEEDSLERELHDTQMKSYIKSQSKKPEKKEKIGDMDLQELVEKFISKDSLSIINLTGKTFEFEGEPPSRDEKKIESMEPPVITLTEAPKITSRIIHIRAKSETTGPKPLGNKKLVDKIPGMSPTATNKLAAPQYCNNLVLKEPSVEQSAPSPVTAPSKNAGIKPLCSANNSGSRNNAGSGSRNNAQCMIMGNKSAKAQRTIPLQKQPIDLYVRSISSGTFTKQSSQPLLNSKFKSPYTMQSESKHTSQRSQSIGKRSPIGNVNRGLSSDRVLPALDNSPVMKKAAISQKYNTSGKRKKSEFLTEGTTKEEAVSKGDFCYYVSALTDKKAVLNHKYPRHTSGTRLSEEHPAVYRHDMQHKKTLSADMLQSDSGRPINKINAGVRAKMEIYDAKMLSSNNVLNKGKGRNQKGLTIETPATTRTLGKPRANDAKVSKTAKHVEQVYLNQPRFKSDYLNSLKMKQVQSQYSANPVHKADTVVKSQVRAESQRGLGYSKSISTLPLQMNTITKITAKNGGYAAHIRGGKR